MDDPRRRGLHFLHTYGNLVLAGKERQGNDQRNGMNFCLDGRTALVTGATRGLGIAMARALGQAGANVVVNHANNDADPAATVAFLARNESPFIIDGPSIGGNGGRNAARFAFSDCGDQRAVHAPANPSDHGILYPDRSCPGSNPGRRRRYRPSQGRRSWKQSS